LESLGSSTDTLKETAKAIQQVQKATANPEDNQARKQKYIAALEAAWAGNGML
jgi:hypothetical protein